MNVSAKRSFDEGVCMGKRSVKTYNCPSCGARIALRDINVKSDLMLCRACGKTTSCSRYLQREAASKALGDPPKRVRVIHEEATSDRTREERIEWRYGLWGVLFGVFLMCVGGVVLWKDIGWYCGRFRYATNPELGLLVSPFIFLAGFALTVFSLFGKFSLSIFDGWCTYFIGVGKIGRRREFKLQRDTSVGFEVAPTKRGSEQYWKQIRVSNDDGADVVIGSLPQDVAEYFYQWLVYWAEKRR